MKTITIDFETYWTTDFSLSKISFVEYIMGDEFETISVAVKEGSGNTRVVFGEPQIQELLDSIDWSNTACIAHNGNEFDFPLLVWKFNCHPKLFVDTLCLSRPLHQSQAGGSLKKLSEHYGLPVKDSAILMSTKGKRYADLDLAEMAEMARYNKVDTDNTYALFKIFEGQVNDHTGDDVVEAAKALRWHKKELMLSDMTARMICYPSFEADIPLLGETLEATKAAKAKVLEDLVFPLGVLDVEEVRASLASAAKFADILRSLGVDPPTKISKTTTKEVYALAKTDEAMTALLDHDDDRVQAVAAARLDVKSTLLETRLTKMKRCAELMNGLMPVPLGYHSATTGRWGGRVWNPQNLPRINPKSKKLTDALRKSLRAPDGYKVVVSDLSGVELRVNHYLWDVASTKYLYEGDPKADLYIEFAASLFGKERDTITKDERQLAKVAQLGLGFGAGAATFRKVAKVMGGIDLGDDEADRVTTTWRRKYNDIVVGWTKCQRLIAAMHSGAEFSPDPRGLVHAGKSLCVLPSGRVLQYPGLAMESTFMAATGKNRTQFMYGTGRNRSKVYSGLMDENLVQAIARDIIAEQALHIQDATGLRPALTVHDELVYVVREDDADTMLATMNRIMRRTPAWLPGIVLWSEGDIADTYGDAK